MNMETGVPSDELCRNLCTQNIFDVRALQFKITPLVLESTIAYCNSKASDNADDRDDSMMMKDDQSLNALGALLNAGQHLTTLITTGSDESLINWIAHVDRMSIYHVRMLVVHYLRNAEITNAKFVTGADKTRYMRVLSPVAKKHSRGTLA